MKTKDTGSVYIVSRAVEDPFDATFELGEDISKSSNKLRWPVALGILGSIILLILLLLNLYYLSILIYNIFLEGLELSIFEFIHILTISILLIILFAVIATTLIYLTQIYKFNKHLSQRYSLISGLQSAQLSEQKGLELADQEKKADKVRSQGSGKDKHLKNPIFAMLDLVEESMHAIPQITKLLRFCTYFITLSLVIILLTIALKFTFGQSFLIFMTYMELLLIITVFSIFIPTIKLLIDSETLFSYLQTRHEIIDSVRFAKNLNIPSGKDQLERLINYLTENDPYIKSSDLAKVGEFKRNVNLTGRSGKEYGFGAYFSGVNVLKVKSVSLGMPMGEFGVFIKVFKSRITLDKLQALRAAVLDVCEKKNMFPLRIIALQWEVGELRDEAYNFVLENPIVFKNTLTHLQVAAEDVDVYSFIPIISYGKEM